MYLKINEENIYRGKSAIKKEHEEFLNLICKALKSIQKEINSIYMTFEDLDFITNPNVTKCGTHQIFIKRPLRP
ncbi:MAG: hypothetical protein C5S47_02770 [Candidatus Methanogasteraceae archaeon]|nr:MAG: hypothetical protein C5S47_02770 [ANME-2 cluster archaeon]